MILVEAPANDSRGAAQRGDVQGVTNNELEGTSGAAAVKATAASA